MSLFLERLGRGPVLCDGAMGTLLYARGVFINRCYDELNVSQPELVGAIHADYAKAGAEVLESNTFGANRYRLQRHGLEARVAEINRAGVQLARAAAGHGIFVAGSVGPLGTHIEPLGKVSREEARVAFREQIEVLAGAGVDLLVLETFGYVDELHQAVLAAREAAPGIPLLAQVTIDEDGTERKLKNAMLLDISQGGICLKADAIINKKATVNLAFHLPETHDLIHATGKFTSGDPGAVVGVKFSFIPASELKKLQTWLDARNPLIPKVRAVENPYQNRAGQSSSHFRA
jgi:hypothetical protein